MNQVRERWLRNQLDTCPEKAGVDCPICAHMAHELWESFSD